jgi:phytanoyl-CoA hydroxylase
MLSFIRRLKPAYALYNLFHREQLRHNIALYKKFGLKKSYFSSVSSADFKQLIVPEGMTNFGEEDYRKLDAFKRLSEENQRSVLAFADNGYAILRNFFSLEDIKKVNNEIESLLAHGKISFKYENKIMFAIHQSALLRNIGNNSDLIDLLTAMMGKQAVLFQSINFLQGSQQRTHSDSIHMTTFPLGGLAASWLALEDVSASQGALHYYPGSHKLPYYLNSDYGNEGGALLTGNKTYSEYEDFIQEKIKEHGIKKEVFEAKAGDLLIWHANLFHGGEPHTDKSKTRKSMVFHYFSEGVVCYHEITQRPALIKRYDV